jgi:hypothetical protein
VWQTPRFTSIQNDTRRQMILIFITGNADSKSSHLYQLNGNVSS